MEEYTFDFLIVGSGLAGLYTAYLASSYGSVAILNKTVTSVSNSYMAQGGVAAAIDSADSPSFHYDDTMTAGRGLCQSRAVGILVNEARERIRELLDLGMRFDSEKGRIALGLEGGHNRRRVLHAGGDATGKKFVDFFSEVVFKRSNVRYFENTLAYQLISDGGSCFGAYAFNFDKRLNKALLAKNTIIVTGGASGVYQRSTNPFTSIGDGITLAYESDADIENMEFIQFHPSSFYSDSGETFLISEAVRGEGAYLLNHAGERFMERLHELKELAPRDVIAKAIFYELKDSGEKNVFLSLRHLNEEKIKHRFSTIAQELRQHSIDMVRDLIPVAPAAHYMIGGIKTDLNGETTVKNLFACGEAASTGIHGANRLASNSLIECLVFGKRAVDRAKERLGRPLTGRDVLEEKRFTIDDSKKKDADRVIEKLGFVMHNNVGIIRSEESLTKALEEIKSSTQSFDFMDCEYYSVKVRSIVSVCELIATSALLRKESRGGHIREDYPDSRESLRVSTILKKGKPARFLSIS